MRYDLSKSLGQRQARAQLEHLISKGARIELTEKRKQRTYSQNAYLHMILTAWGGHLGYTLDEMKHILKTQMMPSFFTYQKKSVKFYKSTADLDTKQMTLVIDIIRTTAKEKTGYDIPAPEEKGYIDALANEAERYG